MNFLKLNYLKIILGVLVIVLIGVILLNNDEPTTSPTAEQNSPIPPSGVFQDRLAAGSLGPVMVWIPPTDNFTIGSPQTEKGREADEDQKAGITIKPFAIGKYEITNMEFVTFLNAVKHRGTEKQPWFETKAEDSGSRILVEQAGKFTVEAEYQHHPVTEVSWFGAMAYVAWLSDQTGNTYRLPTEAEWEYAARAGTTTRYWWGDAIGHNNANCDGCGSQWDDQSTAPVGSFQPNGFGLYDMLGNVWEWTASPYSPRYDGSEMKILSTTSVHSDTSIVIRGGAWDFEANWARAADRFAWNADDRSGYQGFRVVKHGSDH